MLIDNPQNTVIISTLCAWNSFGSVFQSFALKKKLCDIGYDGCIVTTWTDSFTNKEYRINHFSARACLRLARNLLHKRKTDIKYQKMLNFNNENLKVKFFDTDEKLAEDTSNVKYFIAGSDQIWNPDVCNPVFFLDFVKNGGKRISYAASMGKTDIKPEKEPEFGRLLKNFDYISVRESDCADIVGRYTDKKINVNIDPTFLIDVDEWRKNEITYPVKGKYIIMYMLYWDKSCWSQIRNLQKQTGFRVLAIATGSTAVYTAETLYDVGPGEFLWLFDHAEYIVTSSFHGAAFSIMFNKKFSVIVNPQMPSRIDNLMKTLSVPYVDIEELADSGQFDYESINKKILEERKCGIEYIKMVLTDENQ